MRRTSHYLLECSRRALVSLGVALLLIISGQCVAQDAAPESQVKAAFLYKFTSYVDWPESAFEQPDAPLVIGVVDAEDIELELSRLAADHRIKNRSLIVRRVNGNDPLFGIHALFIGKSVGRINGILENAKSRHVLTVTEEGGSSPRGVINFVLIDQQIRFQISLVAAQQANLKISSRLLSVAQQVITEEP